MEGFEKQLNEMRKHSTDRNAENNLIPIGRLSSSDDDDDDDDDDENAESSFPTNISMINRRQNNNEVNTATNFNDYFTSISTHLRPPSAGDPLRPTIPQRPKPRNTQADRPANNVQRYLDEYRTRTMPHWNDRMRLRQQLNASENNLNSLLSNLTASNHPFINSGKLSKEQINRFPSTKYQLKNNGVNEDKCAICLDVYRQNDELRILCCFDKFHIKCIDQWLSSNNTCPCCKYDLLKYLRGVQEM